jgi:CheY-like chemotaxis protein
MHFQTYSQKVKPSYRVLVAEDCPDSRMLITEMLEQSGLNVTSVCNGKECLDGALEAWKSDTPFDVILMDIQMPEMDGHTAARQLRANGYTLPIVAMTARSSINDEDNTLVAGCNAHISKLSGNNNLVAEVIKQVERKGTENKTRLAQIPLLPIVPELLKKKPEYARSAVAFLNKLPNVVETIRNALFRKDFEALKLATIDLGSTSMLGYTILADHLQEIQRASDIKAVGELNALMPKFERVIQEMLEGKKQVQKLAEQVLTRH